jgi:peptide/nickel transport system permease protein
MSAFTFGFLIGGAVLVETVFSWGGFGQYAVQAVVNSDFEAIQGVVLISALLTLFVYMLVDFVYFWVDPRIKSLG